MQNRFCAQLRLAILGAALTGIFVAPSARADIEYNLTNLGALGGTYSIPYAINNSGQIVGVASVANGDNHAFLYQNGSMVDLGTLGGTFSGAQAINNLGVVVGTSTDSTGQSHGFMYSSGIMSALPSLPNTTIISVNGVNDLGQMVGAFRSSDTVDYPNAAGGQAFVYSGGVVTPIPAVGFNSSAFAINRTGIVVGRISNTIGDPQAAGLEFRYENGQLSTVPPNILGGSANAINDAGQIAGTYGYPNYGSRAFIWQGDSATFITSQMDEAIALGINNLGQGGGDHGRLCLHL